MKTCDLIPDRYYYFKALDGCKKYFKHKNCEDIIFYSYPFRVVELYDGSLRYLEQSIFLNREWFDTMHKLYETDISIIIDSLPNSNIDKKIFLRKQKINLLLNESI